VVRKYLRKNNSGNGRAHNGPAIVSLTREQIVRPLEAAARERTGLSARVMLRRYRDGQLTDPHRVADLVALARLLSKNDPILAE
jgi:hypothetical protein